MFPTLLPEQLASPKVFRGHYAQPAALVPTRRNTLAILAVLLLFVAIGLSPTFSGRGDDLSSSFVGCRLLAAGQSAHLYSYDPATFPDIADDDDAWQAAADAGDFTGFLHPYVQTPLWALSLQPLCTRTSFRTFNRIFRLLALLAFAASIWLIARFWAPSLFNPYTIGIVAFALLLSQPFQYAQFLTQTHILFFLATVAALILAERNHPLSAGLLLACAAAVKLTPAFLLLYWLLTRRYRAAASMAVSSALLWLLTLLLAGRPLVAAYLTNLHRIARVLLVSINNESFAAWWMGRFYPGEIMGYSILPLPDSVRILSTALLLACTIAGGLLDRRFRNSGAPKGAVLALLGATLFAPIAWSHYFIILLAPLMVLAHESRPLPPRSRWSIAALILVVFALNCRPLAPDVIGLALGHYALLRGQFFAGLLCLAALATLALIQRSSTRRSPGPIHPR